MVQILAAGELQRDLQWELAYDGLRATEAKATKADAARPSRRTRPTVCAPRIWRASSS
ncbi:hypothetical protein ACWGBX_37380 [Streptomyces sp. NPDC055037]